MNTSESLNRQRSTVAVCVWPLEPLSAVSQEGKADTEGKAEGHARIRACPGRRDADAHNATDRPQYVHCRLEDLPREDLWM